MALPRGTVAAMNRPSSSPRIIAVNHLRSHVRSVQVNETGRRGILSFLLMSTTAIVPEANDSKTALLQEYLKRSNNNKAKNDKERLDDYYKRNYKDYFEFVEGSAKDKREDQLSEAEKGIRAWLQKNKK